MYFIHLPRYFIFIRRVERSVITVYCVLSALRRYARMYESWGCVTLSYSAPARALYMAGRGAELRNIAARLAALTSELCVAESPVMVHCLGLNSVSIYNHIRQVRGAGLSISYIPDALDPGPKHQHCRSDL